MSFLGNVPYPLGQGFLGLQWLILCVKLSYGAQVFGQRVV